MMTHVMLFKKVSGCLEGQDLRLLRSVVTGKMSKPAEVNAACMHLIAAWHNHLKTQNCWTSPLLGMSFHVTRMLPQIHAVSKRVLS